MTAPSTFELPELTEVEPPAIKRGGAPKQVNPWVEKIKSMELDITGKSLKAVAFTLGHELAKVHISAARRAAKELGLGVSIPHQDNGNGTTTATVTIVPKRVVNKDTGSVETPEVAAPELPDTPVKAAPPVKAAK